MPWRFCGRSPMAQESALPTKVSAERHMMYRLSHRHQKLATPRKSITPVQVCLGWRNTGLGVNVMAKDDLEWASPARRPQEMGSVYALS